MYVCLFAIHSQICRTKSFENVHTEADNMIHYEPQNRIPEILHLKDSKDLSLSRFMIFLLVDLCVILVIRATQGGTASIKIK